MEKLVRTFISYSSKQRDIAAQLDDVLRERGAFTTFDQRELKPLDDIIKFMQSISEMDYSIMLLSLDYLTSRPCVFEFSEYINAKYTKATIIPIRIGGFKLGPESKSEIISHIRRHDGIKRPPRILAWLFGLKQDESDWETRFNQVWDYISHTKLIEMDSLSSNDYLDIINLLGINNEEINAQLSNIYRIKDQETQLIEFDKLIAKHPGHYNLLRFKGKILALQGQHRRAIEAFELFAEKFKKPVDKITVNFDLGISYHHLKEDEKAIDLQFKALDINPQAFLSYRLLGEIYLGAKEYEKAKENYLASLRLYPDSDVAYTLGVIMEKLKDNENALLSFQTSVTIDETNFQAFLAMYKCYNRMGRDADAETVINDSYKRFPTTPEIMTEYAQHQWAKKFSPKYLKILEESYSLMPDYVPTRIALAMALFQASNDVINPRSRSILLDTMKMEFPSSGDFFQAYISLAMVLDQMRDKVELNELAEKYKDIIGKMTADYWLEFGQDPLAPLWEYMEARKGQKKG